jgi:hypothetical protein
MQCQPGTAVRLMPRGVAVLGLPLILAPASSKAGAETPAAVARIDALTAGAQVDGVIEIRGRAIIPGSRRFAYYRLLIGIGTSPSIMRPLGPPYDRPVENGPLATWDTDRFPSDEYLLTLQVYTNDDEYESASALVSVGAKPTPTPMILAVPNVIGAPIFVDPSVP